MIFFFDDSVGISLAIIARILYFLQYPHLYITHGKHFIIENSKYKHFDFLKNKTQFLRRLFIRCWISGSSKKYLMTEWFFGMYIDTHTQFCPFIVVNIHVCEKWLNNIYRIFNKLKLWEQDMKKLDHFYYERFFFP